MNQTTVRPIVRYFLDIEVSPNIGLFWAPGYKVQINHDAIVNERAVICACVKREGSSKVISFRWDRNQSDKQLLIDLMDEIKDADEVIGHYGVGFDFPWLRTRILFHGLNPMPLFKFVDTKAWASKHFFFNCNKLDYIAKFLGSTGKIKTEYSWWVNILMKNCQETLAKMVFYCKKDVLELEFVWKKLLPHIPAETHAGVVDGRSKWTCPRSGSRNVILSKRRVTATGQVRYQMQNTEDGSYYSINQSAFNEYQNKDKPVQKVRQLAKARRG